MTGAESHHMSVPSSYSDSSVSGCIEAGVANDNDTVYCANVTDCDNDIWLLSLQWCAVQTTLVMGGQLISVVTSETLLNVGYQNNGRLPLAVRCRTTELTVKPFYLSAFSIVLVSKADIILILCGNLELFEANCSVSGDFGPFWKRKRWNCSMTVKMEVQMVFCFPNYLRNWLGRLKSLMLKWTPQGCRKRGIPKNTWKGYMRNDMWPAGLKYFWRKMDVAAQNRAGWKYFVYGLCCAWRLKA